MRTALTAAVSGSGLVMAVISITILAILATATLGHLRIKLDAAGQAVKWQQALSTAEGGIERAITTLNKDLESTLPGTAPTTPWTGWTRGNTATVGAKTYTYDQLVVTDPATPDRRAIVQVDQIGDVATTGGRKWYRIRSLGTVTMSGVSRVSNDISDVRLRKVGINEDWTATRLFGAAKAPLAPRQASRLIETLVEPVSLFGFGLFGVKSVDLSHMQVDSYDSADPARSLPGDNGSMGEAGNVGTNATSGRAIDAKAHGHVYGSVYTNGGSMHNWQQKVEWEYRTDIYTPVPSITKPPFTVSEKIITAGETLNVPAAAMSWMGAYRVTYDGSMILSSGKKTAPNILTINGPVGSHVIVYVKGNLTAESGNNILVIQNGVKVRFYVDGNITLRGKSLKIHSGKPGDFAVFGMKAPPGTPVPRGKKGPSSGSGVRTVNIEDTTAAIYAPDHDMTSKGSNQRFVGSLVARNVSFSTNPHTQWHFDEALLKEGDIGYRVVNWMEDSWTANAWYAQGRGRP